MTTIRPPLGARPPLIVVTERLLLRMPRLDDAEALFGTFSSNQDLTRCYTWEPYPDVHVARTCLENAIKLWEEGEQFTYIIENRETGAIMGSIGIEANEAKALSGCVLAPMYLHNGYTTEALNALISSRFHHGQSRRADAIDSVDKTAAASVVEKLRMSLESGLSHWLELPQLGSRGNRGRKVGAIRK